MSSEFRFYPCFNGIRVGTAGQSHHWQTQDGVSILVLMELGLEQNPATPYRGIVWVSILVLMELGLERLFRRNNRNRNRSFYPCFNGIRVGTKREIEIMINGYMFLSLF